jgi:GNAT superfamily N-acetyltransferase
MPIRPAAAADIPAILTLVRELAEYEKLMPICVADESAYRRRLFGPDRAAEALVAEADGQIVGYAIWFKTFSSFLARPGMWLEDLYVRPEFRRRGLGKAMILELIRSAHERGYGRVEWSVLNWNAPSIEFYKSLGATPLDDWTVMRVTGEALERLATEGPPRAD